VTAPAGYDASRTHRWPPAAEGGTATRTLSKSNTPTKNGMSTRSW
jgi:hypothetical protein